MFPELAFKFLSLSPTYSESSGQAGIVDNAKEKEREKREKHGDSDGLEAIACLTILNDFTQVYYDIIEKKQEEIEKINSKYSSMKSIESSDNTDSSELDIRINSLYALKLLNELNEILILRINSFSLEQQRYLLNLKLDPKDPEVFLQVIRYVSLVDHTVELSHGIVIITYFYLFFLCYPNIFFFPLSSSYLLVLKRCFATFPVAFSNSLLQAQIPTINIVRKQRLLISYITLEPFKIE